jgi:hypothetical protein
VIAQTDTTVTSIAVDWVRGDIYFISEQEKRISVVPRDGGNTQTVLSQDGDSHKAVWRNLVIDPNARRVEILPF